MTPRGGGTSSGSLVPGAFDAYLDPDMGLWVTPAVRIPIFLRDGWVQLVCGATENVTSVVGCRTQRWASGTH